VLFLFQYFFFFYSSISVYVLFVVHFISLFLTCVMVNKDYQKVKVSRNPKDVRLRAYLLTKL